MKFFIDQKLFRRTLDHISQTVERKNTIPILAHVLIQKAGNVLKFTGTNMDMCVEEIVDVHFPEPCDGAFTAPAHLLHSIVSKLPSDEEIEVSYDENTQRVTVETPHSQYHFGSLSVDDFPLIQAPESLYKCVLPITAIQKIFWKTAFSMSQEDIRPSLNGVCLYRDQETHRLTAVATDGHRLSEVSTPLPNQDGEFPEIIFPSETVASLTRLLADSATINEEEENIVNLEISPSSVRISFDNIVVTSKLVHGTYPSYKAAIPTDNPHRIRVKKQFLNDAISRTALFANEQTRAIQARFEPEQIHLDALGSNQGDGAEEIVIEKGCADSITVNFNVDYLMDVIKHYDNDVIEFALKDDDTAVIITDHGDMSSLFALMPLE
jgi:DNA polymerase III subunit beta